MKQQVQTVRQLAENLQSHKTFVKIHINQQEDSVERFFTSLFSSDRMEAIKGARAPWHNVSRHKLQGK